MNTRLRFALLGSVTAAAILTFLSTNQRTYTPRPAVDNSAKGAALYVHQMRANQLTGTVDMEAVEAALDRLKDMPESAIGLTWASKGPDNRGGRTRGLAINPSNPAEMYTGGVSGGLFYSNNGGLSWTAVDPMADNMAVMTIAFSANGDVYYGTGEGLYNTWTTGFGQSTSSGFPGAGVFRKKANETAFTQLSATSTWSSVGAIVAHPTDNNRLWAATSSGIRMTTDGGATWTNPMSGPGSSSSSWDMHRAANGDLYSTLAGRIFKSEDDGANWTEVSVSNATATDLPRSGGRVMFASAPQDGNYVYCVQITSGSALAGVYRSTDAGATWTKIGSKSTYFDPFCSSQCQGDYDLAVAVDATNKNRIIVGGITVWQWEQGIGWNQVNGFGPFNIHADQHDVLWHPTDSNKVYIVNDGGIFFSNNNGSTWQTLNKNFTTTQFYNMNIGADRAIVGGTQDNGSWVIDGTGNTPNTGRSLGAVDNFSGDGGYSSISWLSPKVFFTEYQGGRIGRSENKGQSFSSFWDDRSANIVGSWMTPFYLYENANDLNSTDSVQFVVEQAVRSLGFASAGQDSFASAIVPLQPAAIMDAASFTVKSGSLLLTGDANGNLSGDGTGSFDASTGAFYVEFNSYPAAEIIAHVDVSYPAGAELIISSNTNNLPFKYTSSNALNMGDTLKVQDPVSSMFIVGGSGSVWMTRGSLDFTDVPEWYKLANIVGTVQSIAVSEDGNYAFIGTENGRIYRIAGLNGARSLATADQDFGASSLSVDVVATYAGRNVTGLAIDPNNNDRVLAVLGNYNNSQYIYYSSNATSTSPTFVPKDGNWIDAPVYSVTFDKGNSAHAIIGTEFGVFSTQNINAANPDWAEDNAGLGRYPVFTLKQYRTSKSSTSAQSIVEGDIFAGTFGGGIFHTGTLETNRPIGTFEEDAADVLKNTVKLFPNPATDKTTLEAVLAAGTYTVSVIDMNGRLVKNQQVQVTAQGSVQLEVNLQGIQPGLYTVGIEGKPATFGRLLIVR